MRYHRIGIGTVLLLAAAGWLARAGGQPAPGKKAPGGDAALAQKGEYLVNRVGMCGDCHTPHDDQGQPDRARQFQGASLRIRPKAETKKWADEAPDITRSGMAGDWSEADLAKFLMTGKDPDGGEARPPMPAYRLNDADARAVAAYLRSLPGKKGPARKGGGPGAN